MKDSLKNTPDTPEHEQPDEGAALRGAEVVVPTVGTTYDPVGGDFGPFDGDQVDFRAFDFSDFAKGGLDLGSMLVPVPHDGEVQVAMGENGPQMIHIHTPAGRMTPVAFAAPRRGNLWEESMPEVIQGMVKDGLTVTQEQGPWGEEIVAEAGGGTMRVIGVQGHRWMMRMTLASTNDKADQLAAQAREVLARSFVYRGQDPIPAGNVLPVTIPQAMAEALRQQMEQRAQQASAVQQPHNFNDGAVD
ncbi:DUF3710 domain-containing protein [Corynebacterium sp. 4HC-13]|uniref:DUF3710 domain-containing protein n=2 Tax=Corynebacterium anserum TaxID=2684406 RepID=A0A7G7YR33_9CORY|nr:DUF3710 domain-containing protein [Corynebacterium anserum]QNH96953.1 DUF3710 domain-containing protein [Corynebacterium anserum]